MWWRCHRSSEGLFSLAACNTLSCGRAMDRPMARSTTVSVHIDAVVKKRPELLAKSTGWSRLSLDAEAITEYLDLNGWQVAGIARVRLCAIIRCMATVDTSWP
jgi:hypothetical protein